MSGAAQISTASMPAAWLRAGDQILSDGIICRVLRVSVTPGQPTFAVVQKPGGQQLTLPFGPTATVARVTGGTGVHAAQGALV